MKKSISVLLCFLTVIFLVTGCANTADIIENADDLMSIAEDRLEEWNATDFRIYLGQYDTMSEEDQAQCDEYIELQDKIGSFVSVKSKEISETEDEIYVIYNVEYEKGETIFKAHFNMDGDYTGVTVEYNPTLLEKLQKAGMNTILGMGIVFIVLIVMSYVISLFAYIPKLQRKFSKKGKDSIKGNVTHTVEDIVVNTPSFEQESEIAVEEDMENEELVAVITAAIMEYHKGQMVSDGFAVRSIKRRKSNNWNRIS